MGFYNLNLLQNPLKLDDFLNNKGYGTTKHRTALKKFSFTKIHRQTFEPISSMVSK